MNKKESALREIKKLINIIETYGNVLVPNLPDKKETFAQERLIHFVEYLVKNENMIMEEIDSSILNLNT